MKLAKKEEKLKGDSKENNQSNLTKHVRNTKKYFLTEGTFIFICIYHPMSSGFLLLLRVLCSCLFIFHQLQKLKFQTTLL